MEACLVVPGGHDVVHGNGRIHVGRNEPDTLADPETVGHQPRVLVRQSGN
jgi:hypothetical protein